MNILTEAFTFGIIYAIFGFVISTLIMYASYKNFNLAKYTFWKDVLFANFVSGFIGHLFFQYIGLNHHYCKYGIACKKKVI